MRPVQGDTRLYTCENRPCAYSFHSPAASSPFDTKKTWSYVFFLSLLCIHMYIIHISMSYIYYHFYPSRVVPYEISYARYLETHVLFPYILSLQVFSKPMDAAHCRFVPAECRWMLSFYKIFLCTDIFVSIHRTERSRRIITIMSGRCGESDHVMRR